ncbi:MAG TPA: GtrA family protein [Dehalococcoidia bacterium]|nr:GtrA family protein [Dehalococcoidia bacterium]
MQPELIAESEGRLITAAREMAVRLHLPTTFVKFLIVGGVGFVINQLFLFLFYDTPVFWFFPDKHTHWNLLVVTAGDARLLVSSIVAVELAIVFQFNAHERWTFRHRGRNGWVGMRFVKFNVSSAISPIIVVVSTNALTPVLRGTFGDLSPYIANGIGVLLGFSWNWGLNSLVIWPHGKTEERTDIIGAAFKFIRRQMESHRTIIKFAAVGAIGYVIYTAVLFVMYDTSTLSFLPERHTRVDLLLFTHTDVLLLITTLVGTQASIVGVFTGHNLWTFTDWQAVRKPLWLRFLQFEGRALVSTLGILTVAVNAATVGLGVSPYIALFFGLVAAFTWNWLWDTQIIWAKARPSP